MYFGLNDKDRYIWFGKVFNVFKICAPILIALAFLEGCEVEDDGLLLRNPTILHSGPFSPFQRLDRSAFLMIGVASSWINSVEVLVSIMSGI